jgi:hypothetical protein
MQVLHRYCSEYTSTVIFAVTAMTYTVPCLRGKYSLGDLTRKVVFQVVLVVFGWFLSGFWVVFAKTTIA